jgi:hypothetical protein
MGRFVEEVARSVAEAEIVDDMMESTAESVTCHRTWIISAQATGSDIVAGLIMAVLPTTTPVTVPVKRLLQ